MFVRYYNYLLVVENEVHYEDTVIINSQIKEVDSYINQLYLILQSLRQ